VISCPRCATENKSGALFCKGCGASLGPVSSFKPAAPAAPTVPSRGPERKADAAASSARGLRPPPVESACPACGSAITPDDLVCPSCELTLQLQDDDEPKPLRLGFDGYIAQLGPALVGSIPQETPAAGLKPISPPVSEHDTICPACGAAVNPGTKFCGSCGLALRLGEADEPATRS